MALIDEAQASLDGVQDNPAESRRRANAVLATVGCSGVTQVVALWALGRAKQELGDLTGACEDLRCAADAASPLDERSTEARIRTSLAWALMTAGRTDEAFSALEAAEAGAEGVERSRVEMQRGLLQFSLGRYRDGVAHFDAALPGLRHGGDTLAEARLLVNRGAAYTNLGLLEAARLDLTRAIEVAGSLGQRLIVAGAEHNLGFACARAGEVPLALMHFDRAALSYRELDNPRRALGVLASDRAAVLLAAGLISEARAEASAAVNLFEAAGDVMNAQEAVLLAARTDLAAGANAQALERATLVEASFRAAGREPWAALAGYTGLQAEVADTGTQPRPSAALLDRAQQIARDLARYGWVAEAAHARTFVARMALARGQVALARQVLAKARPPGQTAPSVRVQLWHGRALLCVAEGDTAGANAAVRRGLGVVDDYREALGGAELRANASALGTDLAKLGLRLALADGRPATVFAAVEYHRAGSLRVPAVRPPADNRLAEALSELRRAETEQRTAVLEGQQRVTTANALAVAERRVRDVSRLAVGSLASPFRPPRLAALRKALEDRVLVSYVTLDDTLHAVVVEPRRSRLVPLGEARTAAAERNHLTAAVRRALHSLMNPTTAPARHATAAAPTAVPPALPRSTSGALPGEASANHQAHVLAALEKAAERLDNLLIAPLGLASDTEVVIVPTAFGHGLPWATLPSLHGRGVTIAPSATLWLQPRRPRRNGRPFLVAGPDLVGAGPEVQAIGDLWESAYVLTGPSATIEAVLEGFVGTDLVHIAAHGTFRADSPLFSSLRLFDGPLTVLDLEGLQSAPATVVLPACSAAAVDVRVGDELIGTTAALLGVGVISVIAPVVAVPDEATATFSVELHRHLKEGFLPAVATAKAIGALRAADDPLARITAACFVCVGADDRPGSDRRDDRADPDPDNRRRRSTDDPRRGHRA